MIKTPAWLENYDRPSPAMMGAPIAGGRNLPSRYTGAGKDGIVQKHKPVTRDIYEDHEGEYVVNAEDTVRNGGEKGVEEKLGIKKLPIPMQARAQFQKGGYVRPRVHKYQNGGYVHRGTLPQPLQKTFTGTAPVQNPLKAISQGIQAAGAHTTNIAKQMAGGMAAGSYGSAGPLQVTPEMQAKRDSDLQRQKLIQQTSTMERDAVTGQAIRPERIAPPIQPVTDASAVRPGEQLAGPLQVTPEMQAKRDSDLQRQKLIQQTDAAARDDSGQMIRQDPIQTTGGQPTTTQATATAAGDTDAQERDYFAQTAGDFVTQMQDIANGTSPVFQRMSDMAFNNLNPQLQVGLTLTAMQIAQNPGMSKGMAQTAMAQAIRNVGVQQSGLAAQMASKAMDLAFDAIGKGFTMSQGMASFYETARQNARSEGWTDFEYASQYGSDEDVIEAYRSVTGKDLDPAAIAEIRGYARAKRGQDIVMGNLNIESAQTQLGTQQFGAITSAIGQGATLGQILQDYPGFGQDADGNPLDAVALQARFDSIYDASPLGDKEWNRANTAAQTYLNAGQYTEAAAALSKFYPGIDFTKLANEENGAMFMSAMNTVTTQITAGQTWESTKAALQAAGMIEALGGEAQAEQIFNETKLNNTPTMRLLRTYPDEVIAVGWPGANADQVRGAIAEATLLGGFVYNTDGDLVPGDPDVLADILKRRGITVGAVDTNSEAFKTALSGTKTGETFILSDKTFRKTAEGAAEEVTKESVELTESLKTFRTDYGAQGESLMTSVNALAGNTTTSDSLWNRALSPQDAMNAFVTRNPNATPQEKAEFQAASESLYINSILDEGSTTGRTFVGADGKTYTAKRGKTAGAKGESGGPFYFFHILDSNGKVIHSDKNTHNTFGENDAVSSAARTVVQNLIYGS